MSPTRPQHSPLQGKSASRNSKSSLGTLVGSYHPRSSTGPWDPEGEYLASTSLRWDISEACSISPPRDAQRDWAPVVHGGDLLVNDLLFPVSGAHCPLLAVQHLPTKPLAQSWPHSYLWYGKKAVTPHWWSQEQSCREMMPAIFFKEYFDWLLVLYHFRCPLKSCEMSKI